MIEREQEVYIDNKRGICLYMLQKSPISEDKRDTALYRATAGTKFAEMALDNRFSFNDMGNVCSKPLREYNPICAIGRITIYKHKSNINYYVSMHRTGSPPCYTDSESDIQRFRRMYGWLWEAYMQQKITFEEYLCENLLTRYLR